MNTKSASPPEYSDLKNRWSSLFNTPPPKNMSRRLLAHALAHEDQLRLRGGLKPKIKKALQASCRGEPRADSAPSLSPGSRLVREWNGKTYLLEVTDDGFKMEKMVFRSLSAAAKCITGSHWNGRAFFGLVKRTSSDRNKI